MTTAVVCAAFDAPSDDRIERRRDLVEREGLRVRRAHRPHLTLSAARVDSVAAVIDAVHEAAQRHRAIHLTATGFGSFDPGVLFVEVAPSAAMRALQRDVHTVLASSWPPAFGPRSAPDRWIAHCTLATRVPPLVRDRLLAEPFEQFPIVVDALAVIAVGGSGDLALVPLGPP